MTITCHAAPKLTGVGVWRRWAATWPAWAGYAAAGWSAAYATLGLYWTFGGNGFPFAPIDEAHVSGSILEGTPVTDGAPVMAVIGLLGTAAAWAMARGVGISGRATGRSTPRPPGRARPAVRPLARASRPSGRDVGAGTGVGTRALALIAGGWIVAAGLTLIIPDYTMIALVAFAPLLLVFSFTGVPGEQNGIGDILYWHRTNLIIIFLGGVLWAAATLAYQRRARGACLHCGRHPDAGGGRSREDMLRWGRRAVAVAITAPLLYEITRVAWYFGYPLGITPDFLRMMQDTPGMLDVGLGCAIASTVGGVLTHGLVSSWGETYPRWLWFKKGRPVPPALAVVPASIVAVSIIPAGLMVLWTTEVRTTWALWVPSMLWLAWGVGLGAATITYHLRRRGACRHCGQGDGHPEPIASPSDRPEPSPH
ncbi:hypothetical protein ACWT_3936 [Actinoplanes sp. SE50]|uniref:hypothetical protein n=1 Tax=unclassified Actinoplanes TaxID=2626549 RepID=UPI00023ED256|nr:MULTISPECIES: hypothetical protein [unclassified Actinoplanes]AEV84960.1 hypothetical protein ACPL_4065 [Actinoplanes sp. SE50/110]ATO83351.1 hypothetical protein ACWT_3936 [Actinoplanes sp. SE50]SLM00758.1 hypothetical protein ACSP50_3991 [Actinoplanes sp. SE50/110]